jgi:hypothetical protein
VKQLVEGSAGAAAAADSLELEQLRSTKGSLTSEVAECKARLARAEADRAEAVGGMRRAEEGRDAAEVQQKQVRSGAVRYSAVRCARNGTRPRMHTALRRAYTPA